MRIFISRGGPPPLLPPQLTGVPVPAAPVDAAIKMDGLVTEYGKSYDAVFL